MDNPRMDGHTPRSRDQLNEGSFVVIEDDATGPDTSNSSRNIRFVVGRGSELLPNRGYAKSFHP